MFEAKLGSAETLKKIVESLQTMVQESNMDCSESGMSLQCIDSGHVALVFLQLRAEGFDEYRCDRNLPLGINFGSLNKILKCATGNDSLTLRADDGGDVATLIFESGNGSRVSEFDMKLLNIDTELLSIPESDYEVVIKMQSSELARVCRDLLTIGETVTITATKGDVKFAADGDLGTGSITLKPSASIDDMELGEEEEEAEEEEEEEDEDGDKKKKKKRKTAAPKKKAAAPAQAGLISLNAKNPALLTVSLKFLNNFAKAASLSDTVEIQMQNDLPLMVDFTLANELGNLRFYLAPKGDDTEE